MALFERLEGCCGAADWEFVGNHVLFLYWRLGLGWRLNGFLACFFANVMPTAIMMKRNWTHNPLLSFLSFIFLE